jgi:hypothetical protein
MVMQQTNFKALLEAIETLSEEQKQIIRQQLEIQPLLPKKRTAGLGEGTIWMSEDFVDPLPDEFWLGKHQ